tara:strand:- start:369 stop:539 length:171 start_codon:yes stop_codon:yes gene_type:complete
MANSPTEPDHTESCPKDHFQTPGRTQGHTPVISSRSGKIDTPAKEEYTGKPPRFCL